MAMFKAQIERAHPIRRDKHLFQAKNAVLRAREEALTEKVCEFVSMSLMSLSLCDGGEDHYHVCVHPSVSH